MRATPSTRSTNDGPATDCTAKRIPARVARMALFLTFLLMTLLLAGLRAAEATEETAPAASEEPSATTNEPPATTDDTSATTDDTSATTDDTSATTDDTPATADEREVVNVWAKQYIEDPEAGTRTFLGNVRFERTDGYLYADKVTIFYDPKSPDRRIIRTLAEDNVRLKEADIVATCDVAEFTDGNNIIDLTGSVVVLQGEDRMEAEHFRYDRRTGKRLGDGGVKFRFRLPAEPQSEEATPATSESSGSEGETSADSQ